MEYIFDARNQSLGRLASKVAHVLRGKNSASYLPNKLSGNKVIIENLKNVKFTGNKFKQKIYYRYSGYHGGIKARKMSILWDTQPEVVLRNMVYKMLPVNRSRNTVIRNLRFR